jgi:hypothetical protein
MATAEQHASSAGLLRGRAETLEADIDGQADAIRRLLQRSIDTLDPDLASNARRQREATLRDIPAHARHRPCALAYAREGAATGEGRARDVYRWLPTRIEERAPRVERAGGEGDRDRCVFLPVVEPTVVRATFVRKSS